jgi:hypothetical protein
MMVDIVAVHGTDAMGHIPIGDHEEPKRIGALAKFEPARGRANVGTA